MSNQVRNDDVGLFLSRELETILSKVLEVQYSDLKYAQIIPVATGEVAESSESYTYRVFDAQGKMQVIQDKASDLPRADILRKEVTLPVRSLGGSFAYTVSEVRAAAAVPGMNLEARRANALRRASEEAVNEIALFGNAPSGMKGFLNSDQIDKVVPNKWFDNATTDEMLEILNEAPTRIVQGSRMKETPNTILLDYNSYRIISTTARSSASDETVLSFFLKTNPFIRSIEPINELSASNSVLSKDRLICYDRSPEKLQLHIPRTLELLPPERKGLEYSVAGHMRVGGTAIYYPKSVLYVEKA
tara:strand:- start:6377 stop:7285 length:909 start_codon:yes stop_codon:yes gene_type:complete